MDKLSCILLCSLTDYDTFIEEQDVAHISKKSNMSSQILCMRAMHAVLAWHNTCYHSYYTVSHTVSCCNRVRHES